MVLNSHISKKQSCFFSSEVERASPSTGINGEHMVPKAIVKIVLILTVLVLKCPADSLDLRWARSQKYGTALSHLQRRSLGHDS